MWPESELICYVTRTLWGVPNNSQWAKKSAVPGVRQPCSQYLVQSFLPANSSSTLGVLLGSRIWPSINSLSSLAIVPLSKVPLLVLAVHNSTTGCPKPSNISFCSQYLRKRDNSVPVGHNVLLPAVKHTRFCMHQACRIGMVGRVSRKSVLMPAVKPVYKRANCPLDVHDICCKS